MSPQEQKEFIVRQLDIIRERLLRAFQEYFKAEYEARHLRSIKYIKRTRLSLMRVSHLCLEKRALLLKYKRLIQDYPELNPYGFRITKKARLMAADKALQKAKEAAKTQQDT